MRGKKAPRREKEDAAHYRGGKKKQKSGNGRGSGAPPVDVTMGRRVKGYGSMEAKKTRLAGWGGQTKGMVLMCLNFKALKIRPGLWGYYHSMTHREVERHTQ